MDKTVKILENYRERLTFLEYSSNTIECYSYYLRLFLEYTDKPRTHIFKKDAYSFFNECNNLHWTVKNQIIGSLKLFYRHVLNTELDILKTQRPRKHKRIPRVIENIENRLILIKNIKHRVILECGYRCALRVSEVCNILVKDVDLSRRCILIRDSKFNKDRYVPVSEKLEFILIQYFEEHSPSLFLFEGQHGNKYSVSSCQKIFKKYIDYTKSFHTLRHSCATDMIENNTSLRIIQEMLGHASSRTTEIYTHVSMTSMLNAAL